MNCLWVSRQGKFNLLLVLLGVLHPYSTALYKQVRRKSWNKAVHVSTWQIAAKYLLAQLVLWVMQTQAAANWSKVVFKMILSLVFNCMCRWMTLGRLGLLFSASLATVFVVSVQRSGEVCNKGCSLSSSWFLLALCAWVLSKGFHRVRQGEMDL